jgi:outer membrane lipoprotein-sorting protein
MMGNSWMGSDFTNDDLTKESETDDYDYTLLGHEEKGSYKLYKIECIPKPDSAVVWGKVLQWIREDNYLPYRVEFYDEKGKMVKYLDYADYKTLGGRVIPTRWVMKNTSKEGNSTIVQINRMEFDVPISDDIFTLRNLQKTK